MQTFVQLLIGGILQGGIYAGRWPSRNGLTARTAP